MLQVTIKYKTGAVIKNNINYLHIENSNMYFTVNKQVHGIFESPVKIPLENIVCFDLEEITK